MNPNLRTHPVAVLSIMLCYLVLSGCSLSNKKDESLDQFFSRQNALHNGDYLAEYPLHNADSCIIKLKAEVPEPVQAQACQSLWYHLPRVPVANSFRLLELYETHFPNDTVRAFAQIKRAEFYVDMAAFDSVALCLQEATEIYTRLNRPLDLADVSVLQGRSAMYRNNFSVALDAFYDALSALNSLDTSFTEMHAIVHHDIAMVFERIGQNDKSRQWLFKIWNANMAKLDKPWFRRGITAAYIAKTYFSSQPDSSVFWANKAKEIFEQSPSGKVPNRVYYFLGRAYSESNAYDKAYQYIGQSYRTRSNKKDLFDYYQHPLALGKIHLELGQLDSAMYYLEEAKLTPDTGNLAKTFELMAEVYARKQQFEKAWMAEKENFRLTKIKFTSEKIIAAADADARYQASQKSFRIQELEAQQKIARQNIYIVLLGVILLMGGLLLLYWRQRLYRRLLEHKKNTLEQEKRLLEQEKILAEAKELLKTQELTAAQKKLTETKAQLIATIDTLALKNQMIEELQMSIENTGPDTSTDRQQSEKKNLATLKILTPADWNHFQKRFDEQLPGIIPKIRLDFPGLTSAEIRLFLLIKLGFEPQEISDILGISRESVWRSRHRLSKKLNLPNTATLDRYIFEFTSKLD